MAYLVVKVDSQEVCRQELKSDEPVTIGRALDCTLWLANPKLSRLHCKIIPDAGKWLLVDTDSHNGTYMYGERIRRHVLSEGDVFNLDKVEITYRDGPFVPPRPAAPAARPNVPTDLLNDTISGKPNASAESSIFATRSVVQTKPTIRARPTAPIIVSEPDLNIAQSDSTLSGQKPLAFSRPPAQPLVDGAGAPEPEPAPAPPRDYTKPLIIGGLALALILMIVLVWLVM